MTQVTMTLQQVLILAIYIFLGIVLAGRKKITPAGIDDMVEILLYLFTPAMIFHSFATMEYRDDILLQMGIAFLSAVLAHLVGILIGKIAFRKEKEDSNIVLRYCLIFSNCGFFTLPILRAMIGPEGVFFGSIFVAVFNLFTWSYGLVLISGGKEGKQLKLEKIILNPNILSFLIGLALFFLQIRLPYLIETPLAAMSVGYSPLAMIILGAQMVYFRPGAFWKDARLWKLTFLRNLAIPLLMLLPIRLMAADKAFFLALLLPAAAPVAGNAVLFATMYERDVRLTVQAFTLSTLLSLATFPLMTAITELLYG